MRILHVAESAKGGVGSYLAYVAPHQIAMLGKDSVRVIAPEQHHAQLGPLPPQVLRTYDRPDRSGASLLRLAAKVSADVREFQPEMIHAHSTFAGLVVRAMYGAFHRRPAILYCAHGWSFNVEAASWKMDAMAAAEKAMASWCDCVVAISRHEAEEAHRIGIEPRRVQLVANGIPDHPAPPPAPWDDARLKVLFVGRLDRQKGVDVLLAAAAALPKQICVRIAGASVADEVRLDIPPNVELLGWLDPLGVAAQLQAADVVAAPSRWEGFGLAVAEAMRAGKPVIASRVGGLCELVEDGVSGRLVPPDDAEALAAALLADGPDVRRAMGACGRARYLQDFTAERMNDELLDIYAQFRRRRQPSSAEAKAPATPRLAQVISGEER